MDIVAGRIIVNGIDITSGASREGMAETTVGGVRVQYQPGENLRQRQVILNGSSYVSLGAGSQMSMSVNGIRIRAAGDELWINGEKVNFDGKVDPTAQAKAEERFAALKARFPGVQFAGDPAGVTIGDRVQIEPGAHLELMPGLVIDGNSRIGPEATIAGGQIHDSRIDGTVSGGSVEGCTVGKGATISGGNAERCTLESGARISGGNAEGCTLKAGARISGGNAERMVLEPGARISGGNAEGFTLEAGQRISGGSHQGALNEAGGGGATVVVGDLIVGGRSAISLGNVSGSFVSIGSGSVVVRQNIGTVGPGEEVVGVKIDRLG
jgi:hypothetical protein